MEQQITDLNRDIPCPWVKPLRIEDKTKIRGEGISYSHVISLGAMCLASGFTKTLGWKRFSCPFDWIVSTKQSIIDSLETNFKQFLNKEYYIDLPGIQGRIGAGHRLYSGGM